MALIKCPECGQEISDKAKFCIHCGFPLVDEAEEISNVTHKTDYEKAEPIATFIQRSCAGEIVAYAILLEIVFPAVVVPFFFMGYVGWIIGGIFASFYVMFSIMAPFEIVKIARKNGQRNSFNTKRMLVDRENKLFIFEGPEEKDNRMLSADDILRFDGPNTLVVTHLDNKKEQKMVLGYTTRQDVLKLREVLQEFKNEKSN